MGELPVFVGEVPDYAVRDGRMHITMGSFEIVMPVDIFMVGCRLGARAVADWQKSHRDAEIIPFRPQTKFERVYEGRGGI